MSKSISPDTIIGPYRVVSKIGEGGMGEVYLAEDSRLHRKVALKILPSEMAANQDRMRRFKQEATAAAALNHPNIAHIYEIGESEGTNFIAMEFVEGVTLREKIHLEQTELKKLLRYLQHAAEGLAKAHSAGIVHRDLKPDNIMITREGHAKVLDFGLAKLIEQPATVTPVAGGASEIATAVMPQHSIPGTVMGTVGYMAPEQAQGKVNEIDHRSDIFAFGCILYEAATRQKAFAGKDVLDSLHNTVHAPTPQIKDLNPIAPDDLQRIVRRCLAKDPEKRYQSIKDVAIDLEELRQGLQAESDPERSIQPTGSMAATSIGTGRVNTGSSIRSASENAEIQTPRSTSSAEYLAGEIKHHKGGAIIVVALLTFIIAGIGYGIYRLTAKRDKPALSFQSAKFTRLTTTGKASGVAISPDGKYVVHVQDDGGQQSLWTRQVATQSNVQIVAPAAVEYSGLTFSPDGNYIYYTVSSQEFTQGALFQVPTLGGAPKKLLEILGDNKKSFSPDGKQLAFTRMARGKEDALMIANADGTNERKLVAHKNPPEDIGSAAWSPDGKSIAYNVLNFDTNDATLYEAQVADGSTKPLTAQRWLHIHSLSWLSDGSGLLMLASAEQRFVYQIWQFTYPEGEAHRLTNDLNNYQGMSLTADTGTLAVVQSEQQASIWIAPVGDASRARPVTSGSGKADTYLAWTPDGRVVYQSNAGGNNDIWIVNADGGNPKQLTANTSYNELPEVSPDGRYIVFRSDRSGTPHLWRMNIDGSDQRQLANGANGEQGARFSPDGRWLVYRTAFGRTTVWKMPADGGEPVQLTDKISRSPTVSPDGKLVAYFYRDENAPWRIAVAPLEGGEPLKTFAVPAIPDPSLRWTPDGRAVAYIDTKNGVSNIIAQPLNGGAPKQLTDFKADRIFWFAYSRDGKQLALSRGTINNDVVLISNFK